MWEKEKIDTAALRKLIMDFFAYKMMKGSFSWSKHGITAPAKFPRRGAAALPSIVRFLGKMIAEPHQMDS